MTKIKTLADLNRIKDEVHQKNGLLANSDNLEQVIQIKVGMATCGIASGAKEIMKYLIEECDQLAVDANIKQTGCLGYCYAEPMVEVAIPGAEPKVFGYVDNKKVREIIEKYIIQGEKVEGEIPISFKTIND
jgi:NADP-reducing hydrogenase subunit HndB